MYYSLCTIVELAQGDNLELDTELAIKDVSSSPSLFGYKGRKVSGISVNGGICFINLKSFADLKCEDVVKALASDHRVIRLRKTN